MEKVGNQPTTVLCDAKLAYAFQDLGRWSEQYQVPITPNPHLKSIDVTPLLLGAIAARDVGVIREYTTAVFEAYWVNQAAFKDTGELLSVLEDAGITNAEGILEASAGLEDRLESNISSAEQDGVFGVPSFVCEAGLYFGNDRLDFLEQGLAA
jgi:2-hydroxychromene-2-carboxylate isomerase